MKYFKASALAVAAVSCKSIAYTFASMASYLHGAATAEAATMKAADVQSVNRAATEFEEITRKWN